MYQLMNYAEFEREEYAEPYAAPPHTEIAASVCAQLSLCAEGPALSVARSMTNQNGFGAYCCLIYCWDAFSTGDQLAR